MIGTDASPSPSSTAVARRHQRHAGRHETPHRLDRWGVFMTPDIKPDGLRVEPGDGELLQRSKVDAVRLALRDQRVVGLVGDVDLSLTEDEPGRLQQDLGSAILREPIERTDTIDDGALRIDADDR